MSSAESASTAFFCHISINSMVALATLKVKFIQSFNQSYFKQSPTITNNHQQSPTITNNHQQSPTIINNHQQSSTIINNHQQSSTITNNHQQSPTITNNHHSPWAHTCGCCFNAVLSANMRLPATHKALRKKGLVTAFAFVTQTCCKSWQNNPGLIPFRLVSKLCTPCLATSTPLHYQKKSQYKYQHSNNSTMSRSV
jgi:hypothetical protein